MSVNAGQATNTGMRGEAQGHLLYLWALRKWDKALAKNILAFSGLGLSFLFLLAVILFASAT